MWWRKRKRNRSSRVLIVSLDKDSCERFDRLKVKIPGFDNNGMIASAVRCLEQKTDKIIKRQATRRIRALKNEGHSPQQIANYLNKKGFPTLAEMNNWDSETISSLLKKEKGNLVDRAKNARHRNQQPGAL